TPPDPVATPGRIAAPFPCCPALVSWVTSVCVARRSGGCAVGPHPCPRTAGRRDSQRGRHVPPPMAPSSDLHHPPIETADGPPADRAAGRAHPTGRHHHRVQRRQRAVRHHGG